MPYEAIIQEQSQRIFTYRLENSFRNTYAKNIDINAWYTWFSNHKNKITLIGWHAGKNQSLNQSVIIV